MAVNKEKIKKWLINYQHNILMERYKNIEDGAPLREFFSKYIYPKYEDREEYTTRAEFFRKAVKIYTSGRIGKVFGGALTLFLPILTFMKKMKELPKYLKLVVELYDLTEELDNRVVDTLYEMINDEKELNETNYKIAIVKSTTYSQRKKQIDSMISIGEYARDLVKRGGILDFLIENLPHMPLFTKHKSIRMINDIIDMIKTCYRIFKTKKDKLNYFRDYVKEKEYQYLDYLYKKSNIR